MLFHDLNLHKNILKALDDQGFTTPTTIQQKAFSVIMSGRDVVGLAQTGTGKTLAFLLPILNQFKFAKQFEPRTVILVPTRELVMQIVEEIEKLTTYMNVRVCGVYGGVSINTQIDIILDGQDIVVATPGRFYDLALNGSLKLKAVQKVVIDEMDEMLNLGFRTQLKNILELLPPKRQTLLFSATMHEDVEFLIDEYFNNPEKIEAAAHGTPIEKIKQSLYNVPNFHSKVNLLINLLENQKEISKVLVFTKSRKVADMLFEIVDANFPEQFGIIHSNKSQNYRFSALRNFQNETHRGLIATDLVSRGLDISDVTHVINFDMPEEPTNYIHRIGRTGRADKDGIAISFVTPFDEENKNNIEALMKMSIEVNELPASYEESDVLLESEKPVMPGVNYMPEATIKHSKGAFHEKIDKNKKVNLGGSYKRTIKDKYKKRKTRGQKKGNSKI
jgi:ATP-dependent RNA helicase RhlE